MEKEKKLSFSIPSKPKPPKPTPLPVHPVSDEGPSAGAASAAPQFVTEFDPSKTLGPVATVPVIAPLPNSGHFLLHRARKPPSLPTAEEEAELAASTASGPTFVLDTSVAPDAPAAHIPYGLTLRNTTNSSTTTTTPSEKPPPPPPTEAPSDPMLRRFKEDMTTLPDHRGFDEFLDMPVEGFGAALLAGYGWAEGKGIGRNNTKGDTKVIHYDRRAGTQGLGYNPSDADPKKSRSGDWIAGAKKPENGNAKKRDRDRRERIEEKHSQTERGSGVRRAEREVRKRDRNGQDNRDGQSGRGNKVWWLQSHIRVRVISKKLGGRLYLKKGEVVDVVGPTTCDIRMDEGRELVQAVEQEMLETALPQRGGSVLVLYGKHKGVYGSLVEKNLEEETGLVQDADTKDMIRVQLDQIAEYIGDPELLGY